ncbi:hypothetical protein [uncultured Friedmanniella sp.]|uniref:hypothetical protein n=1 Tax=uncultured Friedmanniella sp. TaxID=335381 RepID=UPI0035CB454C
MPARPSSALEIPVLDFLLGLVLVIGLLLAAAGTIWAFTSAEGPGYALLRRGSIARTARRESADLDRRYEQLLRG